VSHSQTDSDMAEPEKKSDQPGLADPPASVWTKLGVIPEAELRGGFQSKVFLAKGTAGRLIVKLVEAGQADVVFRDRVEVARQVAQINPSVVGPLAVGSDLVFSIDQWSAVFYPYVEGSKPDTGNRRDVETMATTLATLHGSLRTLTAVTLPPVSALQETTHAGLGQGQLIHGDYAAANLISTPTGLKIIDFDECGHGSVEFEIGNTLYMVLFDAWHAGTPDRYERFRSWFVDAYQSAASTHVEDSLLDEAIRIRAKALERWLAKPAEAPIGIRTSPPEWRRKLHRFVVEVLS